MKILIVGEMGVGDLRRAKRHWSFSAHSKVCMLIVNSLNDEIALNILRPEELIRVSSACDINVVLRPVKVKPFPNMSPGEQSSLV